MAKGKFKDLIFTTSKQSNWEESITSQLRNRKLREQIPFEDVYAFAGTMFDKINTYKGENIQLNLDKEKLQQQLLGLQQSLLSGNDPAKPHTSVIIGDNNGINLSQQHANLLAEKNSQLEKKMYQLQEELAELHKRKSDNAQKLIDLKTKLEEECAKSRQLTTKLDDREHELMLAKEQCEKYKKEILKLEERVQLTTDEHQALHIMYNALSAKYQELTNDHQALVNRWMKLKKEDAERLNAENEKAMQERLKRQLEGALNDMSKVQLAQIAAGDSGAISAAAAMAAASMEGMEESPGPSFTMSQVPTSIHFSFEAHDGEVDAVKWFNRESTGDLVATGGGDRKVKLWKISDTVAMKQFSLLGSNASITSIDVDNDFLLASSNDFASRVWSLTERKLRRTLTGHSNKVMAVKFLGTPNKIVSGSYDRTLKIWDINRNACVRTLFAGSSCNDLVNNHIASTVISGHFDKRIRFWDTRTDSTANEVQLQGKITSLDISPSTMTLLCSIRDDTIETLDLRTNHVVKTYTADNFKICCDYCRARFSPDNQLIACGSGDGSTYIWNVNNSKVEKILSDSSRSSAVVVACSWSPDGRSMITVDRNKKASIWI